MSPDALADGDHFVINGLAHDLQDARAKLWQLIQEQHTPVSQGDLVRVGPVAAAHLGCEMVWCGARKGRLRIKGTFAGCWSATE